MMVTSPVNELRNWTRAQAEAVSRGWWVLLLGGLLSVVAGGIIFSVDWTVDDLVVFVGTLLLIRGALTMSSIPVDGSLRTGSIVLGVVEIFVGIGVFVWPGPALLVVAFSIGWLLLFRSLMAIIGSISNRKYMPYWGLVLAAGILEAVVALFLLSRPDITLIATVLAIGFATTLYGVLQTFAAFEVKNLPSRFDTLTRQTDAGLGRALDPVGS